MTAKEHQDDSYYVGVEGSLELRKTVLETARSVVYTVREHNRIQHIQEEKLRLRTKLVHIAHDMRKELHELNAKLPKNEVPQIHHPVASAKRPAKPVVDHKLDKIEAALAEIEARMKNL